MSALRPSIEIERGGDADSTWNGWGLYRPEPEHRGNPGWLHGGLAATILDHVCARVAAAAIGHRVVTGRLDLRYRRPVVLDDGPFPVTATATDARTRTVKVRGAIKDRAGLVLVEASALFVVNPEL
jgi:acyl-coenzyme A thioesterase PaaI-like protein